MVTLPNSATKTLPNILTKLGSIALLQPRQGYHFSIDSILLASFVSLKPGPVLDLGAGSGIITRLLIKRGASGPFTAVEVNPLAAQCCASNLAAFNALVLEHDMRLPHQELKPQSFATLVSNPPFGQLGRGRVNPQPDKALARHQHCFEFDDLWAAAQKYLFAKGRLGVCLPARLLDQALGAMQKHKLMPKRLRMVHGRVDMPAKIVLLEAIKNGGSELKVEPPLIIYTDLQNTLHPEVQTIYDNI